MAVRSRLVFFSPSGRPVPPAVGEFARESGQSVLTVDSAERVLEVVNRTYPSVLALTTEDGTDVVELCRVLKRDAFTGVVPVVVFHEPAREDVIYAALEAGADEVLSGALSEREQVLRLQMAWRRTERDVSVHPTTRLPGTARIERDIAERIRAGGQFAVCYADLDHFKEFNDRYGYNEGDRVILLLSKILRDIVVGYTPDGFVGHIGGDDFIFNVPLDVMRVCCEEIIALFDELIPYQYTEEDRRSGYFLGRDRRGNILWVPLMTLSIGVVTNASRRFTHTARVSELATEMKSFAKKLPGSIYAVDRRSDSLDLFVDCAAHSPHPMDMPIEP
jgi:GGDEF domain-containing protein